MTHKTEVEKVVLDDGTQVYRLRYQCDKEEMEIIESMNDEQKEQFVRALSDEISYKYWKTVDDELYKLLMYGDAEV